MKRSILTIGSRLLPAGALLVAACGGSDAGGGSNAQGGSTGPDTTETGGIGVLPQTGGNTGTSGSGGANLGGSPGSTGVGGAMGGGLATGGQLGTGGSLYGICREKQDGYSLFYLILNQVYFCF